MIKLIGEDEVNRHLEEVLRGDEEARKAGYAWFIQEEIVGNRTMTDGISYFHPSHWSVQAFPGALNDWLQGRTGSDIQFVSHRRSSPSSLC